MTRLVIACVSCLTAALAAAANPPFDTSRVRYSAVFTDGVILQRAPAAAAIFGTASPGAFVSLLLTGPGGYSYRSAPVAVTSSRDPALNCTWRILLPPQPPGLGYTLEALCTSCTNTTSDTLSDIGFGDVYICSGQSNMECPVLTTVTRNASYIAAATGVYDHVRVFQMGWRLQNRNTSTWVLPYGEADEGGYPQRQWSRPRGPGASLERFSALCWYFGKAMADADLANGTGAVVPIGLIATAVGGTTIQEWMTPSTTGNATCAMGNCGYVEQLPPSSPAQPGTLSSCTNASLATVWSCPSGLCSSLWHSMVAPFVNMTIAAAIWYQGEQNIIYGRGSQSAGYQCQQIALIAGWRAAFSSTAGTTAPDFPFGVTTLAGGANEGFPLWSPYEHATEDAWLACATGPRRLSPACQDMVDDWVSALRVAQTGGVGHAPSAALPNVFIGQGFDQGEPCMCDRQARPPGGCWANGECYGSGPFSLNGTWNYQNAEIHPRVKHIIGERLARALLALQRAAPQPTPVLSGCRLDAGRLILSFDAVLLNGEAVSLQPPGPGRVPLEFRVGPPTNSSTGWVFADELQLVNATAVAATFPTGVTTPTAVRYAFGNYPCCPELNASTFFCPPSACPIVSAASKEPATPFWATIAGGKCYCDAPWSCDA